jgi:hypothetical protein
MKFFEGLKKSLKRQKIIITGFIFFQCEHILQHSVFHHFASLFWMSLPRIYIWRSLISTLLSKGMPLSK